MFWGDFSSPSALPNVGTDVGATNLTTGDTAVAAGEIYTCVLASAAPNAVWEALASSKRGLWTALGNSTTVVLVAFGNTATGTATTRNVATTNLATSLRRLAYVSTVLANGAGTRHAALQFWRGNAPKLGGFVYTTRFVIDTVVANPRWFVGLMGTAGAYGNVDPSTLTNILGFGIDVGQTTVRLFTNDGAGVATAVDLGASFPAATADVVYEARIFCAPNGSVIGYSLERLDVTAMAEGTVSADIPANTQLLSPQIWTGSSTAVGAAIAVVFQSIETPY